MARNAPNSAQIIQEFVMRKPLLILMLSVLALPLAAPLAVSEANALPKCRNVAGYEPKQTCEARNQRAQWQAQQTARMTAQLVAQELANQAAQAESEEGEGFMAMVSSMVGTAIDAVRGLF
jgi:hypothetical protein